MSALQISFSEEAGLGIGTLFRSSSPSTNHILIADSVGVCQSFKIWNCLFRQIKDTLVDDMCRGVAWCDTDIRNVLQKLESITIWHLQSF